ncbi:MAG TPA: hypothetical protein VIV60_27675 [Polyangiaceae bacterium]
MNLQNVDRLQQLLARVEKNARLPRVRAQGLGAAAAQPAVGKVAAPAAAARAVPIEPAASTVSAASDTAAASSTTSALSNFAAQVATQAVATSSKSDIAAPAPKADAPSSATTTPAVSAAPDLLETDPSGYPSAAAAQEAPVLELEELPLEDVSLEDIAAVELELAEGEEVEVEVVADAPSGVEPDVKSSELISSGWNDSDLPASAAAPAAEAKAATQTPFTAPPSLDELTFSEPPPPPDPVSKASSSAVEIEPPPISAAQAISESPGSIDAALLAASEAQRGAKPDTLDDEAPAVTPPPESGPQVAMPPLGAPGVPSGLGGEAEPYRPYAPTIEQLGEVIELDQSSGPPLELAPAAEPASKRSAARSQPEELEYVPQHPVPSRPPEMREPMQTLVGGFTEEADTDSKPSDTPPPHARIVVPAAEPMPEERGTRPIQPALPEMSLQLPTQGFGDEAPTAASSVLAPVVTSREPVATTKPVVSVIASARTFQPSSFLELLDASLALLKR